MLLDLVMTNPPSTERLCCCNDDGHDDDNNKQMFYIWTFTLKAENVPVSHMVPTKASGHLH